MGPDWLEGIKCAVPRGFSRYYVMEVLGDGPKTGKEIIDKAQEESGGRWRPSPGLIYPLLGRLVEEGMIAEHADGDASDDDNNNNKPGGKKNIQYEITSKGARTIEDICKIGDGLQRQVEVMTRLGTAGRFVASEMLERVAGAVLTAAAVQEKNTDRYRNFLKGELARLGENDAGKENDHDKNGTTASGYKEKDSDTLSIPVN